MGKWTDKKINEAMGYRVPKRITSQRACEDSVYGAMIFELCPTCDNVLDRTYQKFCSECGQKLKWADSKSRTCISEKVEESQRATASKEAKAKEDL